MFYCYSSVIFILRSEFNIKLQCFIVSLANHHCKHAKRTKTVVFVYLDRIYQGYLELRVYQARLMTNLEVRKSIIDSISIKNSPLRFFRARFWKKRFKKISLFHDTCRSRPDEYFDRFHWGELYFHVIYLTLDTSQISSVFLASDAIWQFPCQIAFINLWKELTCTCK